MVATAPAITSGFQAGEKGEEGGVMPVISVPFVSKTNAVPELPFLISILLLMFVGQLVTPSSKGRWKSKYLSGSIFPAIKIQILLVRKREYVIVCR